MRTDPLTALLQSWHELRDVMLHESAACTPSERDRESYCNGKASAFLTCVEALAAVLGALQQEEALAGPVMQTCEYCGTVYEAAPAQKLRLHPCIGRLRVVMEGRREDDQARVASLEAETDRENQRRSDARSRLEAGADRQDLTQSDNQVAVTDAVRPE